LDKSGESYHTVQNDIEETLPKQRSLPQAKIPRKQPQEASGADGRSRFQFARTYQDFEDVQESFIDQDQEQVDQIDHIDQGLDDRAQEPDSGLIEVDLGRLEKRKMHLQGLKNMVPDLQVTPPPQPRSLYQKPKENMMPFLSELFEQISLGSVVQERKPKDPFASLPKYYPTSEPAESGILQNRHVPRELLNLVANAKLVSNNQGASGRKALLKPTIEEGARDEAAKVSFKQAAGYIRLANNFEIDVEVMSQLMSQIGSIVNDLEKVRNLPVVAKAKVLQLSQKVRLMDKTVFDVKSTNADFARSCLYQYQSALFDRRHAWLSASMVLKGTASELKGADFPQPSHTDPPGRLDMFGTEGTKILKEYDQLATDGKVPTPQNQFNQPHNKFKQSRGGHFGGRQSYGQGASNYRGQGQGQRARGGGGGRPNNRRPRNNYRGASNRGNYQSQPFSQNPRSQKKD
jgi:hypothetical protein